MDGTLTELGRRQNPLVEQNDAGTQSNPQTEDILAIDSERGRRPPGEGSSDDVRNVESRVQAGARSGSGSSTTLELAFILRRATVCHCVER
jgi:hypothetical protein